MSSSVLEQELAALNGQIESVRREQEKLERELHAGEAELERVSADRQRFDALQDLCNALDRLKGLKADALFWDGFADADRIAGLVERARGRVARFQGEIGGILEKQAALKEQIGKYGDAIAVLQEDVRDAYDREARREEEYVVEREISSVPALQWSREIGDEGPFRKALLIALVLAIVFGVMIPLIKVREPERPVVAVVPERLVSMLRKEKPKPPPPKEEKEPEKAQEEKAQEEQTPKEERPKPPTPEQQAARKKAESTGVLAFKESFKDLIAEAPPARLGAQAKLSSQPAAAGKARPGRSLVALPSSGAGSSGGIGSAGISRSIGPGSGERIASVRVERVESKVAEMEMESRPVSVGAGPVTAARTDEEIQIVFDKYKATLYRMYNTELRRNPTLRGRITLRVTIEPGGEVSSCSVESSDIRSPELVAQIVKRVKRFNFGPKEKASRTTILYPIDFLPGG